MTTVALDGLTEDPGYRLWRAHRGMISLFAALIVAATAWLVFAARRVDKLRYELAANEIVLGQTEETVNSLVARMSGGVDTLRAKYSSYDQLLQGGTDDSLYIVVSVAENQVAVHRGDSIIYRAVCSTGKGTVLQGKGRQWKFETPRGRRVVLSKEVAPLWRPPDWYFVEEAKKKGRGVVLMGRGTVIDAATGEPSALGSGRPVIAVQDTEVVRLAPDGSATPFPQNKLIVAGGSVVIPPLGTRQRSYTGELGAFRLNLGDGYALHGTKAEALLGKSVTHGCVRLGQADLTKIYDMTPLGTEVFFY